MIFDQSGAVNVYFGHKATMKDFHKEVIAVKIKKKTKSDALEVIRKGIVYSMKIGTTFCLHVDKTFPDFCKMWTSMDCPLD